MIVSLVALSLGGLVILQGLLLRYAMTMKEQAFRRNVMAALGQISNALTTGEALTFVLASDSARQVSIHARMESISLQGDTDGVSLERNVRMIGPDSVTPPPIWVAGRMVQYRVDTPQRVMLKLIDPATGQETVYVDSLHDPGEYSVDINADQAPREGCYWEYATDSSVRVLRAETGTAAALRSLDSIGTGKRHMITAVFDNLVDAESTPIEERLDSINVDSVIAATLQQSGIELAYAYGVISETDDSLRLVEPAVYRAEVRASDYRVRLFPLDIFAPPAHLSLYFPERNAYLWRAMGPLLAATVILMAIITACFAYTIRTILRQRRVSDLMVDFINNMTHEFKTPIATVSLASEAIQRADVLDSRERVLHFNAMIQAENRRMQKQAEKILQMAALEDKDCELSLTQIDLHDLIRRAVDAVALHVHNRGGTVQTELKATRYTVTGDRVHLANIIHNLLDNANKYSEGAPEITVRTFDGSGGLSIRIEDHGVGLKPEDRKRVFEKYYRVPTGDRHDVKGFGLGLSYVKMIVEAHGGSIGLYSRYGEGTQVEIILPTDKESGSS